MPGKQEKPIKTIVIDAGHGGTDHGAVGKYSSEKQVALQVALKLGKILEEKMPDVKIVYTRKEDRFDNVRVKADIANNAKGDLFISIHCNSAPKLRRVVGTKNVTVGKGKKRRTVKQNVYETYPNPAKGTETYIWASDRNTAKMQSMRGISSVIVLDANSEETKQLLDTDDPETIIMLSTLRNAFFENSLKLSNYIQDEFTNIGRINRGARQRNEKGILVLQATAMPSVLVELGFISNPEEEDYLNSQEGQKELAEGIYNAVKKYKEDLEKYGSKNAAAETPVTKSKSKNNIKKGTASTAKVYVKNERGVTNPSISKNTTVNKNTTATSASYKVQLLVSTKNYATNAPLFSKLKGKVTKEEIVINKKKKHKYMWGLFRTESEARDALRKARQLGFPDAYVVAPNK
ncbi:N-acetylmuramoyl-L-alanine amidase family protein [Chitinophaga skermanii]|uniref:N-acetylmuramoyl-L-alanine amidase family protein n=1 Tax=Chitinophaga skermanii TaxID=331697 RepID=UPI001314B88A|nr:N-acetylmuramoyl-L-alanine amidase [Chitinophaga skermanii]